MLQNKFYICQVEDAKDLPLPRYQTKQSSGMDLYANVEGDTVIMPSEIKIIRAGVKIALPEGFEAQIRPRSGLAARYGITMVNAPGTIDADYRGEISLIMINFGKESFIIKRGDRIAQMVICRTESIEWTLAEKLEETERGGQGFGHTGV